MGRTQDETMVPPSGTVTKKAIAVFSGGADSATLIYWLLAHQYQPILLSIDYGQRHLKELARAQVFGEKLGLEHLWANVSSLGGLLKGSSQTDPSIPVPDGHFAEETMRQTVVPNRNAILLSIAYGLAIARQAEVVAYAAHGGDRFIYPDCRPEFITALEPALMLGNRDMTTHPVRIMAPFTEMSKADLIRWGTKHKVPYELTWTCYKGGSKACGTCGTCVERLAAFAEVGAEDPLDYEDRISWKRIVEEYDAKKTA